MILNTLLYGILGLLLGAAGVTTASWQFVAIVACVIAIDVWSAVDARRKKG